MSKYLAGQSICEGRWNPQLYVHVCVKLLHTDLWIMETPCKTNKTSSVSIFCSIIQ